MTGPEPLRDLAALLGLPALWKGRDHAFIASGVLDALVSLLRLDLAYVQFVTPEGEITERWWPRGDEAPSAVHEVRERLLAGDRMISVASENAEALQITGCLLESQAGRGLIAGGSHRRDFPTRTEEFLFSMAVEQALIAIEGARLVANEQHRSLQLRKLSDAAAAINATAAIPAALEGIAEQARTIIGAHQAATILRMDDDPSRVMTAVSLSEKYGGYGAEATQLHGSALASLVRIGNRSYRLTHQELQALAEWREPGSAEAPMRGWLAVPLVGRDGRNLGLVQLSDRYVGDFTDEDEAILTQLAHMASVAIENARLYEEARAALEVRDEFISQAVHELKTPLTSLKGFAQIMARRRAFDESVVERIVVQVDRLDRLINDLVNVVRLEGGQLRLERRRVDLVGLARSSVEAARVMTESHTFEVNAPAGPLYGWWDRDRLSEVFENLISNAIKYSPDGGHILVRVDERGEEARASVVDFGVGISPDVMPHLFERFYRSEDHSHGIDGLGLGLNIAAAMIKAHGGRIWAESEGAGQGSEFTFTLPTGFVG